MTAAENTKSNTLPNQTKWWLFSALILLWLAAYAQPLIDMVHVWNSSNTYTHGFFIPVIFSYLIWRQRHSLGQTPLEFTPIFLLPLFLFQLAYVCSALLGINLLQQIFAYLSLLSIAVCWLGLRFCKSISFPLFYLVFCIPFGEEFVPQLQDITAHLSVIMLNIVNIPVYQEGLYLYIPNGTFEVAEACAGIRFLIASIALGTLYAYLNYQKLWKRILFIAIACTLPILANGIRAFGIILIGHYSDMQHATGADHLVYGWFFFAFIILLLFWLGQYGRDPEPQFTSCNNAPRTVDKVKILQPFALTLMVIFPLIALNTLNPSNNSQNIQLQHQLQQTFTQLVPTTLSWKPIFADAHQTYQGKYANIELFVAYYEYDNKTHELVSGMHRPFNIENWTRSSGQRLQLDDATIQSLDLVSLSGENAKLYYWYQVNAQQLSSPIWVKLAQLTSKFKGMGGAGFFIAIKTEESLSQTDLQQITSRFKLLE
ncbi:exosortase A [Catenovulum sediminis]|uniref:exosortase A n=1 Tax=Catenovulum sediminis TaxID=1740262 RepID=UPI0011800ED6|nr:exosortase A [Catenovulum sediminis]